MSQEVILTIVSLQPVHKSRQYEHLFVEVNHNDDKFQTKVTDKETLEWN